MSSFVTDLVGTAAAVRQRVADPNETVPPTSGEVDAPMRVVVCSKRVVLEGMGDVVVAADVAELLMALDDARPVTIIVDTAHATIDLGFLARLSRDFPPSVAVFVQGTPHVDRRAFHEQGVYRAQFDANDEGVLPLDGAAVDRTALIALVRAKLDRQPAPLVALLKR